MLALPPAILLLVYGVFLLVYAFFALANIFSLAKYGAGNWIGYTAVLFFVSATAIILFFTWQALPPIDWITPVPLFEAGPNDFF